MNIVILGGCGFIGSHLAEALIEENHSVTIFDYPEANRKNIEHLETKVKFVGGDYNDRSVVAKAISGAEIVVHLISSTLPMSSFKNPAYDIETNVIGSVNLFEECVNAKIRKVVFVSSGGTVYGIPQRSPIDEEHPLNPITPYGISKMTIEKFLGYYRYHSGIDYAVLRLSNPYGARQNPGTGQGVIATWMHRIRNDEPIEIWGDGKIVRDYIYIKDAVNALKLAALSSTDQKIFNVGSGEGHSLLEIHRLLEDVTGKRIPVHFKEVRRIDVPANILDVSLIKQVLGWECATGLQEGMREMWRGGAH
jgi:UDP-glucose 4-epimerase